VRASFRFSLGFNESTTCGGRRKNAVSPHFALETSHSIEIRDCTAFALIHVNRMTRRAAFQRPEAIQAADLPPSRAFDDDQTPPPDFR
jgi:hypothetical protein